MPLVAVIVRSQEEGAPPPPYWDYGYPGARGGGGGGYQLGGRNDDRLTYSSYSHRPHDLAPPCRDLDSVSPDLGELGTLSYHQLEERLVQPSQMLRDLSRQLGPASPAPPPPDLNIDIDDIFQKFSDLVRGHGEPGDILAPGHELATNNNNSLSSKLETESQEAARDAFEDEEEDKEKDDKRPVSPCHVCGDRAIAHLHYGGICCYSCKAFFRRAVQSGKDKTYSCKRAGDCEVSIHTRRGCQKCRLEKCKAIGMTASWVLSDEQCEIRFGKGKVASKRSRVKEEDAAAAPEDDDQPPEKQMTFDSSVYSTNDQEMVEHMVQVYDSSWEVLCFSEKNSKLVQEILNNDKRRYSASEMNAMVTTVIQRGIFALNKNHHFGKLSEGDKKKLLVKNMTEMCLIRGALRFNVARKSFVIDLKGEDKPANVDTPLNAEIKQDSLRNLYASEDITRYINLLLLRFITIISFQQNSANDGPHQADGSADRGLHHHDQHRWLRLRRPRVGRSEICGGDSSSLHESVVQVTLKKAEHLPTKRNNIDKENDWKAEC